MTSPKELLQKRLGDIEKWRTLFRSDDFHDILTQAFAHLHNRNDLSSEQSSAVRTFVSILETILELPQVAEIAPTRSLDYDLGQKKPSPKKP
jgi:hypothetical protein